MSSSAPAVSCSSTGGGCTAALVRGVSGTPYSHHVWAPELQYLHGRWVIYFAADDGNNASHRMYALEGDSADSQQPYRFKGKVAGPEDQWAIDGITLEHERQLYFVWSGWRQSDAGFPQVLYIATMSDPWTISGARHEIAGPDQPWEQAGAPLLEVPRCCTATTPSASRIRREAAGATTMPSEC